MTLTAENVRVGVTGAVYVADSGTTLPDDATESLDGGFDDVGYISDNGVTESQGSDVTDIKAWQNGDVVRKVQTKHELTYKFEMIETSETTLGTYYGNYAAGVVEITGEQLDHKSWVLQVIDGDHKIRIAIPDGQITQRADVARKNNEAIAYGVTITCFPDADGVKAFMYVDDGTGS